ncbi:hypothetical protein PV682_32010 [Streptomyces niveiscabiei]|uniref:hypothetical protein n=1 Tax=Streptomyces niveiscabiei TaxID=164115 RepID=UPI0029A51FCC|nr:hypothetical protein [Streptomyces niveiscabiei]MDX3386049.1 hypothetical protein [Streptomyces niveiscabiei]
MDQETDRISGLPFDLTGASLPWDVTLIASTEGRGIFRICLRVHHGFLDGVGAIEAAAVLFPDEPGCGARLPPPQAPSLRALTRVLKEAALALVYRSAWKPGVAAGSSRAGRRTHWRDVPLTALRCLADSHGVTVNDVSLAALGVALADRTSHAVTAGVVISTRTPAERYHIGNRLGFHRLRLPDQPASFDESLAAVTSQTGKVRAVRQRDAIRTMMELRQAPQTRVRPFRAMFDERKVPLVISSVTLPDGYSVFGAEICAASAMLNVSEGFPAYVSFGRTAGNVRCTTVADETRGSLLTVPDDWANVIRHSS